MIVAGVMSGTSADGINVALVEIVSGDGTGASLVPRQGRTRATAGAHPSTITLLAHAEFPFPTPVRQTILKTMNADSASVADLARLNFLLGELYAEAVVKTARKYRVKLDLVGCHGQTIYHQGEAARFLGHKIAATWQTGEGAVIAARLGVPVVSDFRPADMAAGGKGAPLVPFFDYFVYRDDRVGRIAQNIGGIANLTAIPAGASLRDVIAFDTGPGNMVMDAVMQELCGRRFDRDGKIAASGRVLEPVISRLLRAEFFRRQPPKTAGREEFGGEYVRRFLRMCGSAKKADMVATATALTTRSIADAVRRFVVRGRYQEMIVSGGGTKNSTLMTRLQDELAAMNLALRRSDEFGIPSGAKEAMAFAAMAYETWHGRASNVPSATGAEGPAILGKISYG